MPRPPQPAPGLFDLIEQQEVEERVAQAKADPANCKHEVEDKTLTVWPGETWQRLTFTCRGCGRIRGRVK